MKPPTPVRTFAEDEKERGLLGLRKKGMGVRTWMLLGMDGKVQVVEAGKHAIMRRAGLPGRDLRILDPLLSYPSTILGRERAIVLNLEHIKAIITAQEVLLLNSKDPAVAPFVLDLQRRLPLNFDISDPQISKDRGSSPSGSEKSNNGMVSSDAKTRVGEPRSEGNGFTFTDGSPGHRGPNALPFEFRALEACLDATCRCLDDEATTLDNEAYPALDSLTGHISTLNLERVRQIKNRLVTISGRVQKVRDEIEKLLDDDGDMAEMYLTDKLMRQQFDGPLSPTSTVDGYNPVSVDGTRVPTVHFGTEPMMKSPVYSDDEEESEKLPLIADESDGANLPFKDSAKLSSSSSAGSSSSSSSSSSSNSSKNMDVEELEMLLEAYFVQIDGTANKLSALRDYVDDTEDYINIMLDDKQNHLLQMGVILTTATLVISLSVVVTGVFGMNIDIDWFQATSSERFYWVVGASTVGSLLVYTVVIAWCKWKRLLE